MDGAEWQGGFIDLHRPDAVLEANAALCTEPEGGPPVADATKESCEQVLAYLRPRRAQIAYPTFRAKGYPIGDGAVESGNKLVVEARLEGSGMHWAPKNVNPMVAPRACVCSDAWATGWTAMTQML